MRSLITNLDRTTGRILASAPEAGVLLASGPLGWRGMAAELHRIGPDHQPEHLVRTHRLMVHTGQATRFEWREGAASPWHPQLLRPGDVSVLPDGAPNEPRWHQPFEFLAIGIEPAFLAEAYGDLALDRTLVPVRGHADPVMRAMAGVLVRELAAPLFCGSLFGEVAALAVSRHLIGHYGAGAPNEPRGALTGAQMSRVLDRLHDDLTGNVSLATLGREAGVSPFHFARLFRAAPGRSPHRFVLELRIARAQQLIRLRDGLTLTEVAAATGFFDQAHFTRAFKRFVGVAPSTFAA